MLAPLFAPYLHQLCSAEIQTYLMHSKTVLVQKYKVQIYCNFFWGGNASLMPDQKILLHISIQNFAFLITLQKETIALIIIQFKKPI